MPAEPAVDDKLETAIEPIAYTPAPAAVTEVATSAVGHSVEIPSDEALAIRRLRNTLIQKLFTPDRTQNSWTDLRATN
jgi:hypothetical protein